MKENINFDIKDFSRMNVDQHISMVGGIIGRGIDDFCRTNHRKNRQRIKWWTPELSRKRRLVRLLCERFQRARAVSLLKISKKLV